MKKATDSEKLFLDSSIWLAYFFGKSTEIRNTVDSEKSILFTSIISIHEIFKKIKTLQTENDAEKALEFIENNSIIIGLTKKTAIEAVNNCQKYSLHTIDSLVYTSAIQTKAVFVTADNDFRGTPKTRLVKMS